MVYKKYIKRDGKTFGPYYYKSYKVNGKVKKVYIGGEEEYKDWKSKTSEKISWIHRVKKGKASSEAGHSGKVEQLFKHTPSFGRGVNVLGKNIKVIEKNSIKIMNFFFISFLIIIALLFLIQIAIGFAGISKASVSGNNFQ